MTVSNTIRAGLAASLIAGASLFAALPASASPGASVGAAATASAAKHVPVYAYFYQWYNPSSWDRAKQDLPLVGKYSSDDPHVLRDQVEAARRAHIDGFLTSWKSTDALNRRLSLLIKIARSEDLDLGVVYEALDFSRRPLPVATVLHDMVYLVTTWGADLKSTYYGRPVIIWTGIDQYSLADVQSVRSALGDRAYLLAASKQVANYERVAGQVDGEAYYWSSADPDSSSTSKKLQDMSTAVHAHNGLWLAPAASGFDGRMLGGTRVVDRKGGETLVHSLNNAFASSPDGVGVISWNEWSENTYIEPGHKYKDQELSVLTNYLAHRLHGTPAPRAGGSGGAGGGSAWTGARAALALVVMTAGTALLLVVRERRKSRIRPAAHRQLERLR
jgi:hypothetical protein